jgi:hypothetical protein
MRNRRGNARCQTVAPSVRETPGELSQNRVWNAVEKGYNRNKYGEVIFELIDLIAVLCEKCALMGRGRKYHGSAARTVFSGRRRVYLG